MECTLLYTVNWKVIKESKTRLSERVSPIHKVQKVLTFGVYRTQGDVCLWRILFPFEKQLTKGIKISDLFGTGSYSSICISYKFCDHDYLGMLSTTARNPAGVM